jgi:hypothetical protein
MRREKKKGETNNNNNNECMCFGGFAVLFKFQNGDVVTEGF